MKMRNFMISSCTVIAVTIIGSLHATYTEAAPPNNPVFTTLEQVQTLIANALSPISGSLNNLSQRVTTLEASSSASATPPLQGIWVSVGSWEDPFGLGYYFNMSPRVMDNGNHQILADCWATAHFPNGDTTSVNARREDALKLVSPGNVLPPGGAQVPVDLYCSWGGKTLEFHFNAMWDTSNPHTYTSY